jgi:ubiquinone/menaquinone biosynthesis C-methylase UbiE
MAKREETRLELQHDLLLRFMGNRLYLPRVDNPRRILECGYGTGEWAVAVAEEYEDCEVSTCHIAYWRRYDQPSIPRYVAVGP